MDKTQSLELERLLREYNTEETTDKIREIRHSNKIRQDIKLMEHLKKKYTRMKISKTDNFRNICEKQCSFLFNNYTNIFNRILKDELNLEIMSKFLDVLERIENKEIDQHQGSYEIGSLLKKLYIDSALKNKNNIEMRNDGIKKKVEKKPVNNITWKQFKHIDIE